MGPLTIDNLGRYLDPKSLFLGVMEVDELREEEHNRCSPEYCDGLVRLRYVAKNEGDMPTARP